MICASNVSAVASARPQYPRATDSDCAQTSPMRASGSSPSVSGSTITTVTPTVGHPHDVSATYDSPVRGWAGTWSSATSATQGHCNVTWVATLRGPTRQKAWAGTSPSAAGEYVMSLCRPCSLHNSLGGGSCFTGSARWCARPVMLSTCLRKLSARSKHDSACAPRLNHATRPFSFAGMCSASPPGRTGEASQ